MPSHGGPLTVKFRSPSRACRSCRMIAVEPGSPTRAGCIFHPDVFSPPYSFEGGYRSAGSVCVRTALSPRWGWSVSTFPHGSRRGLHSYAASRLKTRGPVPPRRRNSSSHAHTGSAAPTKSTCVIASGWEFTGRFAVGRRLGLPRGRRRRWRGRRGRRGFRALYPRPESLLE